MRVRGANLLHAALILVLAAAVGSCGTSVAVEGTLPAPLIEPIDLAMGVHFTEEFREFVHEERVRERGDYRIDLGQQNYNFFQRLFASMFASTREVPAPPLSDEDRQGLDGVIVLTIEKFGFLPPHVSGLQFFSASIEYRMSVYDPDGVPLATWKVVGYGKSPSEGFRESAALGEATMLAIRDAGARIALETKSQPELKAWLERIDKAAD